jgi:hypothetical protein
VGLGLAADGALAGEAPGEVDRVLALGEGVFGVGVWRGSLLVGCSLGKTVPWELTVD